MTDKDEVARVLAEAHRRIDPTIGQIVRILSDREDDSSEPVKFLEVNPANSPSGILPIAFGPDPPLVPYPSVVVEVTEREYRDILEGRLVLPDGWSLGSTLFPPAACSSEPRPR